MSKDDGGPAFPRTIGQQQQGSGYTAWEQDGMSLRDWFAGQALAGRLARPSPNASPIPCKVRAEWCYTMADAMLAARER